MVDLENQEADIVNIEGWLKVFQEDFSQGRFVRKKKSKSLFLQVGISLESSDLIAMKIREPGLDTTCEFLLKGENFTILAKNCSIQHRYGREIEISIGYFIYSSLDFKSLSKISIQWINLFCSEKSYLQEKNEQIYLSEKRCPCGEKDGQGFKIAYHFPKDELVDHLDGAIDEMDRMIIFCRLYYQYYLNVESFEFSDTKGRKYTLHLNDHVYRDDFNNNRLRPKFSQEKAPAIYEKFRRLEDCFGNWIFAMHSMEKDRFYDNKIRWAVTGLEVYVRWVLRNRLKEAEKDYPDLIEILSEDADVELRRKLSYILNLDFIKTYYIDRYKTTYYNLAGSKRSRKKFIQDSIECRNGLVHLKEDYHLDLSKDSNWELYTILNRLNYLLFYKELDLEQKELENQLYHWFDLYNRMFKKRA